MRMGSEPLKSSEKVAESGMDAVGGRLTIAALPDSHFGKIVLVVMGKVRVVDGLRGLGCPRRTVMIGAWPFWILCLWPY